MAHRALSLGKDALIFVIEKAKTILFAFVIVLVQVLADNFLSAIYDLVFAHIG